MTTQEAKPLLTDFRLWQQANWNEVYLYSRDLMIEKYLASKTKRTRITKT